MSMVTKTKLLVGFATLGLLLGLTSPAQATTQQDLTTAVLTAPDPGAAFRALSAADQALVQDAVQNKSTTVSRFTLVNEIPQMNALANTRCWQKYRYDDLYTYFVIDGHAWHTLIWCANTLTKRITSYSLGAVGAQSDVPGLFYDGVSGSGFYNVGWEVRSYVQYKWHVGWGIVFEDYACSQIRGGATGLYSYRNTCNLG